MALQNQVRVVGQHELLGMHDGVLKWEMGGTEMEYGVKISYGKKK
jgi:hypothetical protein